MRIATWARRTHAAAMSSRVFTIFCISALAGYFPVVPPACAAEGTAFEAIEDAPAPVAFRAIHSPDQNFSQPVWFAPVPGRPGVAIVLEHRAGKAWLLHREQERDAPATRKTLFADWSDAVSDGPWEGLMCVAFHPRYPQNRRFFVKHETIDDGQRFTVVVEKRASEDLLSDSGAVHRTLLKIRQPADNHNGGTVAFGPDGFLYVAMGDGGPQEDPEGYTQSGTSFLGKMLRIDVDRPPAEGSGLAYAIPPDNPYLDRSADEWHHEIWALGFREPWRFSFDRETGDLWLGDVGQVRFEEVLLVRRGENHGWNVREGYEGFSGKRRRDGETYVNPVVAYSRTLGNSVTGGYVYRGRQNPEFDGVYVFGDFTLKHVWALRLAGGKLDRIRRIGEAPDAIASFGQDAQGELYVVGYGNGIIYAIDFSDAGF